MGPPAEHAHKSTAGNNNNSLPTPRLLLMAARDVVGVCTGVGRVLVAGYSNLCSELHHALNHSSLSSLLPSSSLCSNLICDEHQLDIPDFPAFDDYQTNINPQSNDTHRHHFSDGGRRGLHTHALHHAGKSIGKDRSERVKNTEVSQYYFLSCDYHVTAAKRGSCPSISY